jgi:lysophospholipase L1-like esterase
VSIGTDGRRIPVRSLRHSEAPGLGRNFPGLQHLLLLSGALTTGMIGPAKCLLLDAKKAADLLVPLLRAYPDLVLGLRNVPSPTLVGFGASSMEGAGDDESDGFLNRLKPAVAGQELVNLGVGGDTTRAMLRRADDVTRHRPHDLIVLLGCNDYPRKNDAHPASRTAPREYVLNLTKLLNTIRGQRNLFITSFPADPARTGIAAADSATYVGLAKSAAVNCGYGILDLFEAVRSTGMDFLADDGLHYTPAGHRFIAALVRLAYAAPDAPLTL